MKSKRAIHSSNISILYYLLKQRPAKDGKFPICVRVSANGTQTTFSIKRKVHLKNWSDDAGTPIGGIPEISELKNYINSLNTRFLEKSEQLNEASEVTAQLIRNSFEGKQEQTQAQTPQSSFLQQNTHKETKQTMDMLPLHNIMDTVPFKFR